MTDTYICAQCRVEFTKGRPDEEAEADYALVFGDIIVPRELVCEDCYKAMADLFATTVKEVELTDD